MKECLKCLEVKSLTYFDKVSKTGYRNTCRKCRNKVNLKSYLSKPGNLEKRRCYMKEYMKNKYNNSDNYKIYCKLLNELRNKLIKDETLRSMFESKFTLDMNWENKGVYWEVDHIVPALSMIKLGHSNDEINDIENIRPLKISDNRSRNKKIDSEYYDFKKQKESLKSIEYKKQYYQKNKEKRKLQYQKQKTINNI